MHLTTSRKLRHIQAVQAQVAAALVGEGLQVAVVAAAAEVAGKAASRQVLYS